MTVKPTKDQNVLTNVNDYSDTWTPSQKDEPMMAVLQAEVLFTLGRVEKLILLDYFKNTSLLKEERLGRELLGIDKYSGKYKTLNNLTKKGMFQHDTKAKEVLLTPNIVSPRTPNRRISEAILEGSSLSIHKYTGAILNGEYFIHYDVLNIINEHTPKQLRVLRYLLTHMDANTNTVKFHVSRTAKELKVRVGVIREMLELLQEEDKLIYISKDYVSSISPSQEYTVMLSPHWFIKSLSKYVAFRYSFNFFLKVIKDGYPVNYGVFSNYIDDSVTAVKVVKARYNKNNALAKVQDKKALKQLRKGETLNIEFIESDFITIKEEYVNENY